MTDDLFSFNTCPDLRSRFFYQFNIIVILNGINLEKLYRILVNNFSESVLDALTWNLNQEKCKIPNFIIKLKYQVFS